MPEEFDELERDKPEDDEEAEVDWMENLRINGPQLRPEIEYTPLCSEQSVTLEKPEFDKRLLDVLGCVEPSLSVLNPQLTESLFLQAVADRKQMAAWNARSEVAESRGLRKSLNYVEQEIKRYSKIRKLLLTPNTESRPGWVAEWHDAWTGSYFELTCSILGQLLGTQRALERFSCRSVGHTNFETHLVALAKPLIQKAKREASLRIELKAVVAAYAHASGLIPSPSDPNSGFIDAVNMRVSRARKSKAFLGVGLSYLAHYLTEK